MKARRVVISFEIETDAPVKELRALDFADFVSETCDRFVEQCELPKITVVKRQGG